MSKSKDDILKAYDLILYRMKKTQKALDSLPEVEALEIVSVKESTYDTYRRELAKHQNTKQKMETQYAEYFV